MLSAHTMTLPDRKSFISVLVEARLIGVLAAGLSASLFAVVISSSPTPEGVIVGLACIGLVLCAAVDLVSFRVPNPLTYSGTLMMLVAHAVLGESGTFEALLGGLIGGGFLFALSLFSKGTVGMGDAKLAAFGGALVGATYVIQALLAGALSAVVVCAFLLVTRRISRTQPIPYVPFLSLGFIVVALLSGNSLGV